MPNREIDRLFLRTAIFSLVVTLVVGATLDSIWAANYAAAALFGWFNWFALAQALLAVTSQRGIMAVVWLGAKVNVILLLLVWGKLAGIEVSSFLAGLLTFFLVALIEATTAAFSDQRSIADRFRGKLDAVRADFLGRPSDG